jgi:rhodanese-related sulfurtransferase
MMKKSKRPVKEVMMRAGLVTASAMLLVAGTALAQDKNYPKAKVSFNDFKSLVASVEAHREQRLVNLNTFLKMSKEPGVVVLDTRSDFRFKRIHVKGARHLSFSDFTQDNLRKIIPTFKTSVLIYCNNNFEGNQRDFASKVAIVAMPIARPRVTPATQFAAQAKPLMMALNIPTYVNLYGYGYCNVYELHELVNVDDSRIAFEGSIVAQPQETNAEQGAPADADKPRR